MLVRTSRQHVRHSGQRFEAVRTLDGEAMPAAVRGAWAPNFPAALLDYDRRRVALGVSRAQFARFAALHEARISYVMSGRIPASYRDLHNMTQALATLESRDDAAPAPKQVRVGNAAGKVPPRWWARRPRDARTKHAPWRAAKVSGRTRTASAYAVPVPLGPAVSAWRRAHHEDAAQVAARLGLGITAAEVAAMEAGHLAPRHAVLTRLRDAMLADSPPMSERHGHVRKQPSPRRAL